MSSGYRERRLLNQLFNGAKTKSSLRNVAFRRIADKMFGFMVGNFIIVTTSTQSQWEQTHV